MASSCSSEKQSSHATFSELILSQDPIVGLSSCFVTMRLFIAIPLSLAGVAAAGCPFLQAKQSLHQLMHTPRKLEEGSGGYVPDGGFAAVKEEIKALLTDSQDVWPADFGNYGGLMIRLAWHCSGSYRRSDGRGGCDGGRIRHDPELNWPDNANLDKALSLLEPIKDKFGEKLSWGDLIVLTGTTAIESMGGPVLGFCGGRIDEDDGSASFVLGPTDEQRELTPCEVNGQCIFPLGPTTVGLIYVNPEGPLADPDPEGSVIDIRASFGNMGMNDSETVALIGGGHAFGKMHGACAQPPCGDGIGNNTFTSGFEGTWIENPTNWTNDYFTNLLEYEWSVTNGTGGHFQWEPSTTDGSEPPDIVMLTSDVALIRDDDYLTLVEEFAADIDSLDLAFSHAWYKLVTHDMGPVTRCVGDLVPPAQPFQMPLPDPPATLPDYAPVRASIEALIAEDESRIAAFTRLAYQCADTYRDTDKRGGCDGARIRLSPEIDWSVNEGLDEVIALLETAKADNVSYSDLIVLAGMTAINSTYEFCGGRTDAEDASESENLMPRLTWYTPTTLSVRDNFEVKGLTLNEGVALTGRPVEGRSPMVSNELFVWLVMYQFEGPDANGTFTEIDGNKTVTAEEYALYEDTDMRDIVQSYADNGELFMTDFYAAWNKIMIQDRFDGNRGNLCITATVPPTVAPTTSSASSMALDLSLAVFIILASAVF